MSSSTWEAGDQPQRLIMKEGVVFLAEKLKTLKKKKKDFLGLELSW